MRSFINCACHQISLDGHINEGEIGGACGTREEKRNAYRVLVGKPEGKRTLGRQRPRLKEG
jgi:hypothetical protein